MLPQGKWAPLALMTSTKEQSPPSPSWWAPDYWLHESGDKLWGRITVSPASDLKISERSLFNFKENTSTCWRRETPPSSIKVEPPECNCAPGAGRWEHALGSHKVGVWQEEMKAFSIPPPTTVGGGLSFSPTSHVTGQLPAGVVCRFTLLWNVLGTCQSAVFFKWKVSEKCTLVSSCPSICKIQLFTEVADCFLLLRDSSREWWFFKYINSTCR